MKKLIALILGMMIVLTITPVAFAVNFDITPFENNPAFNVEFDEMDDTGEIELADGCYIFGKGDNDDGLLMGEVDIKILPDFPPAIRLHFIYQGEKWCFIDKLILKPADTRYTFEVDRDTEVENGKIYESFAVVITPKTIGLIEDMLSSSIGLVKYRMDGDRNIDGSLLCSKDGLQKLYDAYIESGALDNDFSVIESLFPCTIK